MVIHVERQESSNGSSVTLAVLAVARCLAPAARHTPRPVHRSPGAGPDRRPRHRPGGLGAAAAADLTVNVGGTVRFALLYWAGRAAAVRPDASGTCTCPFAEPYRDQEMVFNGTPFTGTIIGDETQPVSGGGPIHNIGYFADVTSIVGARGHGQPDASPSPTATPPTTSGA